MAKMLSDEDRDIIVIDNDEKKTLCSRFIQFENLLRRVHIFQNTSKRRSEQLRLVYRRYTLRNAQHIGLLYR